MFSLEVPEHAYIFGLLQADGHLYEMPRNRGRISLEINSLDRSLLESIQHYLPCSSSIRDRIRDTNFKKNYHSSSLRIYDYAFRSYLKSQGFLSGRKSLTVQAPEGPIAIVDFIRGWIDGDGSLGLTKTERPFISLSTASMSIATFYERFVCSLTGESKRLNRNKRDAIYNITNFDEKAQTIIQNLYYPNCLALGRKVAKAKDALGWVRPFDKKQVARKFWTPDQDAYIRDHSLEDSIRYLGRTQSSIEMRKWRLGKENVR